MSEVLDLRQGAGYEPEKPERRKIWLKILMVIVLSVGLTTVGIRASDKFFGPKEEESSICPADMAFVPSSAGGFCIDKYEASADRDCSYSNPKSQEETRANIEAPECQPASKKGVVPWRNISQNQAAVACAKAGKRLPTNEEWLQASLGTPDKASGWDNDDCQLNNNRSKNQPGSTGLGENCVSFIGAYDMIGNVWEWVEGTINDGEYKGILLPDEGYIKGVDSYGMPTETDLEVPDLNYNKDYLWIKKSGTRGVARGGYWNNKHQGGVYSVYLVSPPSFVGTGVGFRCVK